MSYVHIQINDSYIYIHIHMYDSYISQIEDMTQVECVWGESCDTPLTYSCMSYATQTYDFYMIQTQIYDFYMIQTQIYDFYMI